MSSASRLRSEVGGASLDFVRWVRCNEEERALSRPSAPHRAWSLAATTERVRPLSHNLSLDFLRRTPGLDSEYSGFRLLTSAATRAQKSEARIKKPLERVLKLILQAKKSAKSPSLRAKRSNLWLCLRDCFVASLLAMTGCAVLRHALTGCFPFSFCLLPFCSDLLPLASDLYCFAPTVSAFRTAYLLLFPTSGQGIDDISRFRGRWQQVFRRSGELRPSCPEMRATTPD